MSVQHHKPQALTVQLDHVPQDLKAIDRWLCWRLVERKKVNGASDWAKVPCTSTGRPASSTNPATWCSFDEAANAWVLGDFDGIGLVLGDDVQGIDLDDCRDPATGELTELARQTLARIDGYAEVSPSGTGIKIFTRINLTTSAANHDKGVEVYCRARYFTVTGHRIEGHDRFPLQQQDCTWLLRDMMGREPANAPSATGGAAALELYKRPLVDWSLERVQDELLVHLDPDCGYSDWVLVGMALHHQGGGDAEWFACWDEWSAQSGKYVEGDCEKKWTSFRQQRSSGTGAVTLASLLAKTKAQRQANAAIYRHQGGAASYAKSPTTATCEFRLLSAEELAQQKQMRWIVKHLLPETGLAVLYGQSGAGKSFLTLDLAAAVAGNGAAWFGFKVDSRPVTYVALEGENGMAKRMQAWSAHHVAPAPDLLKFVVQPLDLRAQGTVQQLAVAIDAAGGTGGMVILDTLARAAPGLDENSGKDMSEVINAAGRLQQLTGGLVLLVAHSGKSVDRGLRGHSSLFAAADAVIEVRRENEQRSWKVEKSKDDADGASFAFKLADIVLGTDDDLEKITSCVVLPDQHRTRKKPITPAQRLALSTLQEAIATQPVVSPDGYMGAHLNTWRPFFYQASSADTPEAKRKAFGRGRSELANAGVLRVSHDVYSIVELEQDDFFPAVADNRT